MFDGVDSEDSFFGIGVRVLFGGGDFSRGDVGHDGVLGVLLEALSFVPSTIPSRLCVCCRTPGKVRWVPAFDDVLAAFWAVACGILDCAGSRFICCTSSAVFLGSS